MKEISETILRLAQKYNVSVSRCPCCDPNQGGSCGTDTIFLGEFDDPDLELTAFFHELGHTQAAQTKRKYYLNKISEEGHAWELGLDLALENGYIWEPGSKEYEYAKECLLSYKENEYNWG